MSQAPSYCAKCGSKREAAARVCSRCGEPYPAPPTVVGYEDPLRMAPQPQAQPQAVSPFAATAFAPPQAAVPQPAAPFAPTAPQPPPPAALLAQPPQVFVPPAAQALGTQPLDVPSSQPAIAEDRRGRTWRIVVGGAWVTHGLLLLIAASAFVAVHLTLMTRFGYAHLNEAVKASFGISLAMLLPALAGIAAGRSSLRGTASLRGLSVVAALAHVVWAGVAIGVLATSYASEGPAVLLEILAGLSVLPAILLGILALAAGKSMTRAAPGSRPVPLPAQSWGAPLVIVLSVITFLRLFVPVAIVLVKVIGGERVRYAADDYFYSSQPFWGAVMGCVLCVATIACAVAMLRRKRWSLFASAGIAAIALLAVIAVPLMMLVQNDVYRLGGKAHLPMLAWTCFLHATPAWVAMVVAVGLRFRFTPTVGAASGSAVATPS